MREGFTGYPEWRPNFSAALNIDISIEGYMCPDYERGIMEMEPSGRRRVVIEGSARYIEAILDAAQPTIEAAQKEIKAAA